ncbi:MAG: hypothetical protein AAF526_12805 [Pseudomonadota bacterium]
MSRVLIVDERDSDLADRRLPQVVDLYASSDHSIDLIESTGSTIAEIDTRIARLGCASDPKLFPGIARRMHQTAPYALLHRIGEPETIERWDGLDGVCQIIQTHGPCHLSVQADKKPDIVLTACENGRKAYGNAGFFTLRLPLRVPQRASLRSQKGRRIGWWGRWDISRANGWVSLIDAFIENEICPDMKVMLLGPGADGVMLPSNMRAAKRARANSSALRALDLAVLPSDEIWLEEEILTALVHGVPVLALSGAVAAFEDRWRLPVANDLSELARLVDYSLDASGGTRPSLQSDLEATLSEIRRDVRVMEAYVMAEVNKRIA